MGGVREVRQQRQAGDELKAFTEELFEVALLTLNRIPGAILHICFAGLGSTHILIFELIPAVAVIAFAAGVGLFIAIPSSFC